MKRHAGTRWTVNWPHEVAPQPGQLVRRVVSYKVRGYYRVDSVRLIRNRLPLPEGYTSRYAVAVTFVSVDRPGPADWTCYCDRKRRREPDKFSPLL